MLLIAAGLIYAAVANAPVIDKLISEIIGAEIGHWLIYAIAVLIALCVCWVLVRSLRSRRPKKLRAYSSGRPADGTGRKTSSLAELRKRNTAETDQVFISYAHADAPRVRPIVEYIESTGREAWIDRDDLSGGDNWAGAIVRAIRESSVYCIMCSAPAYASDNVRREIYLANKYKKAMLPVLLEDADMPDDFEFFLVDCHWVRMDPASPESAGQAVEKALAVLGRSASI